MIGKYNVVSVVAKGGMGTVYKVIHPGLKKEIILKRLTIRGNSTARDRFKQEARILLSLQCPQIVHTYDYFVEGRHHYIAQEFVDGMSLDKLIAKQVVLPEQVAMRIFLSACMGLKFAHSQKIVHRDIKPGNILISNKSVIKLADFGIATSEKELDDAVDETGVTVGTPSYMPPEQFEDSGSVDKRADIYAMGVMLYEMLTGAKPFKGKTLETTKELIMKGKYIAPHKIDKSISLIPRFLIWKMMRSKPERRFQSMDPVIKLVKRYLKEYDSQALQVTIARMVGAGNKPYQPPQIQPKKHTFRNVFLIACASVVLLLGLMAMWRNNLFHKSVLSPFFKPLSVSVTLPATASAQADLPFRVFFFKNDGDTIPEVFDSRRILEAEENSSGGVSSKDGVVYRAKEVYLRPGAYRIKVAAGPYVWWKSVSMKKEAATAHLDLTPYASRNITVHCSAVDRETGKNLTGRTSFSVLYKGRWTPLTSLDPGVLRTGAVWQFMAQSPDYRDELFSLRIDWYQDELFLAAELQKE
ncbi:MAG: serine/threonine protein kinase [Spirochaetaceae bacterium]|nr:serine/threonine protein kinase [Spirochaetaceae bacterium]